MNKEGDEQKKNQNEGKRKKITKMLFFSQYQKNKKKIN